MWRSAPPAGRRLLTARHESVECQCQRAQTLLDIGVRCRSSSVRARRSAAWWTSPRGWQRSAATVGLLATDSDGRVSRRFAPADPRRIATKRCRFVQGWGYSCSTPRGRGRSGCWRCDAPPPRSSDVSRRCRCAEKVLVSSRQDRAWSRSLPRRTRAYRPASTCRRGAYG